MVLKPETKISEHESQIEILKYIKKYGKNMKINGK